MLLATSSRFFWLSMILSSVLLIGFVSIGIYKGEFHPMNSFTTKELKKNYSDHIGTEIRLEFATILNTELIQKDEIGNILTKFTIYNGSTIFNVPENGGDYKSDAIEAYCWVPKKSFLWNTFLRNEPSDWTEQLKQGLSNKPKLYTSSYCKLKIEESTIILTDIRADCHSSKLYLPYYFSYRLFNSFCPQNVSGIIAIIIELIALIIMLFLILMGSHFIRFG